jgi:hypothetical protein
MAKEETRRIDLQRKQEANIFAALKQEMLEDDSDIYFNPKTAGLFIVAALFMCYCGIALVFGI